MRQVRASYNHFCQVGVMVNKKKWQDIWFMFLFIHSGASRLEFAPSSKAAHE